MKLATYLEKNRMTEAEFGEAIGQSEHAVKKWLNGQRFPKRSNLVQIARATNGKVTASDFLAEVA